MRPQDILHFWFEELSQKDWFSADPKIDEKIANRFQQTLEAACKGELFGWRSTTEGRLAEIIVLDQFSRNIYRNSPMAFANDKVALVLAQELVSLHLDQKIPIERRAFAYMPFMHSESLVIHEEAVKLFSQPGLEFNLKFEYEHKKIIERFGRYPHRNEVLNRPSTTEELEFLKTHSGF